MRRNEVADEQWHLITPLMPAATTGRKRVPPRTVQNAELQVRQRVAVARTA